MYNKPTGFSSPFQTNQASTPGFGTAGFGASTPAAGSSIFGQNNAQTTGGGLFGGTTSAFGTQPSTGFNFGATPSAAGGLFGAKTTASTGLFGTPAANASTAFGFGSAGNSMSGGFGTTSTASTGTLFGTSTNPAGSLFGSSGGFGGQAQQPGTTVKFIPFAATDTMVKNGTTQTINTRLQCITAMKEYENKSLEELRVEDYLAGRKGQALPTTGFGFASPVTSTQQSAQAAPFSFGATKPNGFGTTTGFGTSTSTGTGGLFGQPSQTGLATGGLFGQSKPGGFFNTATTTAAQTGFGGFGTSTSTGTGGLFGNTAQKPLFGTTTTQATGLFGTGTGTTGFGQPAASTGFGGFGTSTPATGGLFGNKPGGFGTQTTASAFGFGSGSMTGSNLFSKPIPASTGFGGFPAATTQPTGFGAPQPFGAAKQTGFGGLSTSTATPSFNFNTFNTGTSLFGTNNTLNKPAFGGLGTTGSTGFGGFGTTTTQLGTAPTLGGQVNPPAANQAVQLQQTLLALTHSPYGDSKLFSNMKETSIKREDVLKPTNPAAQKAILANQHKVSPRPMSKIKPKALTGNLNGSKSQLFDGLEEEEFSFGNDTFQARKSVKKLTLKKIGSESNTPSRASSVSGEPAMMSSLRDDDNYRGRVSPVTFADDRPRPRDADNAPDTENIIRSKGISEQINDTPNRGGNMDDTIAILNARNKSSSIADPPVMMKSQNDTVNISIISHDDSNTEEINVDERPMTPPPPHPAGIVLMRPGYYIIPPLEALAELVDEDGNCYVEDFTIGREGYGSIFFPGMTNVANMNFDEIVFFRRKEVIVYPDDDNKPPEGDGLNKKAEITLDCVWPRDKSAGTPIKSPEKLRAMNWQEKIEFNSMKVGAKFIDYRPETGSWVFEVKHFSKYGLLDDSDEEEVSEQDKKRLRTSQAQQVAVQKQKLQLDPKAGAPKSGARGQPEHVARFTIGTDDESEGSGMGGRVEIPMGDDDNQMGELDGEPMGALTEQDDEDLMLEEQPSSHRLASSMGVDPRNMQVMKASFFEDDDMPAPAFDGSMFGKKSSRSAGSPLLRNNEGSGPSLFSSALKSKYMAPVKLANLPQRETANESVGLYSPRLVTPEPIRAQRTQETFHPPVKEYMLLDSGMTQQDYQKRSLGSLVTKVIPAVKEGTQYGKQAMCADAGLFMGRSFRVGWGPGWTLAHSGDVIQPVEQDRVEQKPAGTFNLFSGGQKRAPSSRGLTSWTVHLQKVNIADHIRPQDKTVIQNHREMLEIQLVHSRSTKEGLCPVFAPSPGVEALHQYSERNRDELDTLAGHPDEDTVKHMGMVWDLCVALWGNMPEFNNIEVGKDSYMYHRARREAFSHWLSSVSMETIIKEVQENKYKDNGHLAAILSSLTGGQITEACQLAQKAGDHRLALLLAQAVSNYMPRQMVSKQLEEYIEFGVNNFFNETRLKIYSLLAGQLVLQCSDMTVNTCEDMDWKRALALHLWFCCQADAPIQEAIEIYDRSFVGNREYPAYCSPPLPPYLERDGGGALGEGEGCIQDTCYHLLALYCQKCRQLESVLNPTSSTPSQLDYRLSWHLGQVLRSLSYRHLSPYHAASLDMNFVAHLESLGLWEWAVFIALHLENTVSRESAVRSILSRHVQLEGEGPYEEKEALLRERLHVPPEWIHSAKALRASYEGRARDEAWHLLKAGQWNRSHMIVLRHLAADDIIHENHGGLLRFLTELSIHSAAIVDWHVGGKVFMEYINICESMQQLSESGEPSQYDLDMLLPEVKSLCTKVGSLHCRTSKDRLCQSEMAKRAANFLRLLLTLQAEAQGQPLPSIRALAPYISNLPMPEDYMLQELQSLTRIAMREQTVA